MLGITAAYRLTRVHVDMIYTFISAPHYPARGAPPITCIRVVQANSLVASSIRTAGIVVGIVASLELAWRLGAPLSISTRPVALGPFKEQFAGATLPSAFFDCGRMQIQRRAARRRDGPAGLGCICVDDLRRRMRGARPHGRRFRRGVGVTILIRRTSIPGFGLVSAVLLPLVVGTSPETANSSEGGSICCWRSVSHWA